MRDGVSVHYLDSETALLWSPEAIDDATYSRVLDIGTSDSLLRRVMTYSRVAGATRDEWTTWRKHIGQPEILPGLTHTSLAKEGWMETSRSGQPLWQRTRYHFHAGRGS